MITPSTIYWIGQCDCFRAVCAPFAICGFILGLFSLVFTVAAFNDRDVPRYGCWIGVATSSILLLLIIIGILGSLFIPSTKTAAAMYIIPSIANNEKIQDAGDRPYTLAVEWMEELRPKVDDKKQDDKDSNTNNK